MAPHRFIGLGILVSPACGLDYAFVTIGDW